MNTEPAKARSSQARIYIILMAVLLTGAFWGGKQFLDWRQNQLEERFFSAAFEARESEDWELLKEISERWVESNPQSNSGWLALADGCQQLGDYEVAVSALAEVSPDDPRYLEALQVRGDLLYLNLSLPFDAVKNWQLMLAHDPSSEEAYRGLISFYALSVQRNKLLESIREAISREAEPPESYVYLVLSDRLSFSSGLFRVDEWLQRNPNQEVLTVARAYYLARHNRQDATNLQETNNLYQGDWTEMEVAIKSFPANLNVMAFQIENAIIAGRYSDAVQLLVELPQAAESDHRFWRYRAQILLEQGKVEETVQSVQKCLVLNPYDWRSRLTLSEAYRVLGKLDASTTETKIANRGKKLERTLLSLPNPRDVWDGAIVSVYHYARLVGDKQAVSALENRGVADGAMQRE